MLADIRNLQGLEIAEALAECEAAAAVLQAEGDLDGLAVAAPSLEDTYLQLTGPDPEIT